jgi:hypothetical protein
MTHKVIALTLLLLAVAGGAFYLYDNVPQEGDAELDLTCGFTDDFSKFLKDKGNAIII